MHDKTYNNILQYIAINNTRSWKNIFTEKFSPSVVILRGTGISSTAGSLWTPTYLNALSNETSSTYQYPL